MRHTLSMYAKRGECSDGVKSSSESSPSAAFLDHEIAQLTKLRSGPHDCFGRAVPGGLRLPVSTVKMLVGREGNYSGRGRFSAGDSCHVLSRYLPVKGPWLVDRVDSRAYVSQFSADGSLFVAGCQGGEIRIYNVDNGWKVQKNIQVKSLRWTVTDTSLSPDKRFLVYSSISPIVHIVDVGSGALESVANVTEIHDGLDFSTEEDDDDFGVFSIKFSTDARELVAASNDKSIYIYDLAANKLSVKIPAHEDDVNAVCFADESGHIVYSGSDDTLCKVWDRRCVVTNGQAAGYLVGHIEGVTSIDSHGDGRYLISNGKDQAIKLWDIRKMSSRVTQYPRLIDVDWDYRWMSYPPSARNKKHPKDNSVATYKGHQVLYTLIRCYFSPVYSTGQKYIYTGSSDYSVYIYDLVSGAGVGKLEYHSEPVRDCCWHPTYPMIVSSSWDGEIVRWEFPATGEEPLRAKRRRKRRAALWDRL